MVEVEVEFDYDAELPDELTIRTGDLIKEVKQMEGGWWEGTLKGKRGVFPDNFVKVITKEKDEPKPKKHSEPVAEAINESLVNLRRQSSSNDMAKGRKQCRVLFSYSPTHEDELELKLNDVIDFIDEVEDGWWKGSLNGRTGVFPSNFVEMLGSSRTPLTTENKDPNVESKNIKNENHKADRGVRKSSKISSLIQEAEAKSKSSGNTSNTAVAGSRKRNNSSTENLNPANSSGDSKLRQSPLGKETHQPRMDGQKRTSTNIEHHLINAPKLPPKPVKEQCIVAYPYTALNEDELSLAEGQIINIISKEVEDKGWWKGEIDGKVGVFPDNFVKMITSTPASSGQTEAQDEEVKKKPSRPSTAAGGLKSTFKPTLPSSVNKNSVDKSRSGSINSEDGGKSSSPREGRRDRGSSSDSISSKSSVSGSKTPSAPPTAAAKKSVMPSLFGKRPSLGKGTPPPKPTKPTANKFVPAKPAKTSSSRSSSTETLERNEESKAGPVSNDLDFDSVEIKTEKLEHPTRLRAKAPNRRPPSSNFAKDLKSREKRSLPNPVQSSESMSMSSGSPALSKSLEDMTSSTSKRHSMQESFPDNREANKSRLSFKLVRSVKDVFGGLSNGSHSHGPTKKISNGDSSKLFESRQESDLIKKPPPPKPPVPKEDSKTELIQPKSEEPKKPEWLEELSRKQAVRKSIGLIKDSSPSSSVDNSKSKDDSKASSPTSEAKPSLPTKPAGQFLEEARKSMRPVSIDSSSTVQPLPSTISAAITSSTSSTSSATASTDAKKSPVSSSISRVKVSDPSDKPKKLESSLEASTDSLEDLEALSLLERVRRLEKLLITQEKEHETKMKELSQELMKERTERMALANEVALLKQMSK